MGKKEKTLIKLKTLLPETTFRTLRGSAIRRFRGNVGKQMNHQIYVHRDYATEVVPHHLWDRAMKILDRSNPGFQFNTVMFDAKNGTVRFDQAADFDTAREPHVGDYITIWLDGTLPPTKGHSDSIWHHKWMWVKDDYKGFDVDKAKEWSKLWLSKLESPAKGTDATWNIQLKDAGLLKEQLLMEARATPKQLVEFLRAQIKGTEWEGKVFAVGGFVRDELLGKEPKDLDVVVGKYQGGVEFTTWLGQKLGIYKQGSNPVIYPTFGTANLRLDGVVWNGIDFSGESIDAVMFRKEQYHDPNTRKPTVQYTPHIAVDASRRDITFNSLYKDIATGTVLDPTGMGFDDLKKGIVRTAIDPTIIYTDDALRMFRAVRFATQLGFNLSPEIVDGIKKNLHRLNNTSKERVRDELNKILTSKDPARGFRLLRDTGLLPHLSPDLQKMIGMTQNVHHEHDVFDHTMEVLMGTQPELVRRLIALFHDIGKTVTRSETPTGVHFYGHEDAGPEVAERVMMELKYPRVLIDAVKLGIRHHMKLKHGGDDAIKLSDKSLRKFKIAVGEYLEHILDVIHADNVAHADASAMPNQVEAVRKRLQSLDIQVTKPNLPINGDDLIQMGVTPGPKIGQILSAVTDAWYDNPKISREEAIEIARRMI